MKNYKIIELLRRYDLNEDVKIQVGFNRFDINCIDNDSDSVIIVTEENANNPKPNKPIPIRRA